MGTVEMCISITLLASLAFLIGVMVAILVLPWPKRKEKEVEDQPTKDMPDYDPDQILLIATGTTLPHQRQHRGLPGLVGSTYRSYQLQQERTGVTCESAGVTAVSAADEGHPCHYLVTPQLKLGTVDALVDDFKERLIRALKPLREDPLVWGLDDANQQMLRALWKRFRWDGAETATLPWDHDGAVSIAIKAEGLMDRIIPTASLTITPAQWVWLGMAQPAVARSLHRNDVRQVRVMLVSGKRTVLRFREVAVEDRLHFDASGPGDVNADRYTTLVLDNPNPWSAEFLASPPLASEG